MPTVVARTDTLNERNREFDQPFLSAPIFLNSVPKCGTHLLRNIVRMFVPVEQQYNRIFIQHPILSEHLAAFNSDKPWLSWGHLLFSDGASIVLRKVHHIVLVRDPYDWVLARARFFLSDSFRGSLAHLKNDGAPIEDVLNMMIFGIHEKAPTLQEIFFHNAAAWLGTSAHFVRYEDVCTHAANLDSPSSERFFSSLMHNCGIDELPSDWRTRVQVGADRRQSGTARENLAGSRAAIPEELPSIQKQLVDIAAPGLRRLLGYEKG